MAVEREYEFEGPDGRASLHDLFEGRTQLIVYRAFMEPGISTLGASPDRVGWPEHGCVGCSLGADQVAHPAHLNARDTTLAFVSRGSQADIQRQKQKMGWEVIPWYTITDPPGDAEERNSSVLARRLAVRQTASRGSHD
jgi:predicted dithiol-disulfide oxidoreductase (DUF899 family)